MTTKGVPSLRIIEICGKVYRGQQIFKKRKSDTEVSIYLLNLAHDKFLVLQKHGLNKTKGFVVTGSDKIHRIIELLNRVEIKEIEKEVSSGVNSLEEQCYMKKLRKIDMQKYKNMITEYYDANYPMFIILGVRLDELIESINQKAAV